VHGRGLADCRAQPAASGYYVFGDVHAQMGYASAGRDDQVRGILATLTQRADDPDTNGLNTRDVGRPSRASALNCVATPGFATASPEL
jgi:hypothetical protein